MKVTRGIVIAKAPAGADPPFLTDAKHPYPSLPTQFWTDAHIPFRSFTIAQNRGFMANFVSVWTSLLGVIPGRV